jgi:hypothetical protein
VRLSGECERTGVAGQHQPKLCGEASAGTRHIYGSGGCTTTLVVTAFPAASLTAVPLTVPTTVSVTIVSATTGGADPTGRLCAVGQHVEWAGRCRKVVDDDCPLGRLQRGLS